MHDEFRLIADVGGTNARLAFSSDSPPYFQHCKTYNCADFDSMSEVIDAYLSEKEITQLYSITLAVAGPVAAGQVKFTNLHWSINESELASKFNTNRVVLLNDFAAISYSLAKLSSDDILSIGGDWSLPFEDNHCIQRKVVGVIGPGSGLGMSGVCVEGNTFFPLITEGGHQGFAPESELQIELLQILLSKYPRVSIERILSGPGIENLYWSLCKLNQKNDYNPDLRAPDIAKLGVTNQDQECQQAMAIYFEVLGQAAGDLVLTLGATSGIYIAGGITQRFPEALVSSNFRSAFERKARYQEWMKPVPTWMIMEANPGLIGTSYFSQTQN